jgi:hypothetical protein
MLVRRRSSIRRRTSGGIGRHRRRMIPDLILIAREPVAGRWWVDGRRRRLRHRQRHDDSLLLPIRTSIWNTVKVVVVSTTSNVETNQKRTLLSDAVRRSSAEPLISLLNHQHLWI